jgi:DNA-nicking Smr family endonuclease
VSQSKPSAKKPSAAVTLHDFGDLKRALGQAAKEAAARRAQEEAERARREAAERAREGDAALFKKLVGQVHPMGDSGRVEHQLAKPAPVPTSRQQDEQAVLHESLSDDFDVESLLETDESLSWRRPELGIDVVRKLRRGVWALQGELDLHGMRSDEARERTSGFLREAQLKGSFMARAWARPASNRCCATSASAGWCKATGCWPLCRPGPMRAAWAPWWCCCNPPRRTRSPWLDGADRAGLISRGCCASSRPSGRRPGAGAPPKAHPPPARSSPASCKPATGRAP